MCVIFFSFFFSDDNKTSASKVLSRCEICRQHLNSPDLLLYPGHPDGALEEFIALTDPKLSLFTGDEDFVHELDERPQQKVTGFK